MRKIRIQLHCSFTLRLYSTMKSQSVDINPYASPVSFQMFVYSGKTDNFLKKQELYVNYKVTTTDEYARGSCSIGYSCEIRVHRKRKLN